MPLRRPPSTPGLSRHPGGAARFPARRNLERLPRGPRAACRSADGPGGTALNGAAPGGLGSSIVPIDRHARAARTGGSAAGDGDGEAGWAADGALPETLALGEAVGRGTFGRVLAARCAVTGVEYAVKVLRKRRVGFPSHVMRAKILNEVSLWKDVQGCDDVVHLHKCYEDNDHMYLVQDFCAGGTLDDVMKARQCLGEAEAAFTITGILRMVRKCHAQHIVYGDVKPSNFVVCPSSPSAAVDGEPGACGVALKAVDFGSAKKLEAGAASIMVECGSPLYAAPEVHEPPYGLESDVWSIGVLLYQLLSGEPPFVKAVAKTMRDLNPTSLAYAITYVKLNFDGDVWEHISGGAKDLISKMLERDVQKRITAADALRHPWIKLHVGEPGASQAGAVCGNIVSKEGGVQKRTESERGA
ncbi:unnamed protein product [Ostreobium quekettii]|uniref:Protein kinase domain-containing protein n=1 Tax=Ostreobium quekettii TaxID=121088 RepID=A0A8S1IRZ8_9CHLO|nr:unnamed protein product [Ostreobium quekettii]|eukprot:evm.model.scf_151.16 EVM.evm.TU.scf_151.16   scf_151:114262-118261(-)